MIARIATLAALCLLLCTQSATAQYLVATPTTFMPDLGVIVGGNLAGTRVTQFAGPDNPGSGTVGLLAGLFMEAKLDKDIGTYIEISYVERNFTDDATDWTMALPTLQFTLAGKLKLDKGDTRPVIVFGPTVGFGLNGSLKDGQRLDVGLQLGTGVDHTISKWVTLIGLARYNFGIAGTKNQLLSRDLMLNVGLRINFKSQRNTGIGRSVLTPN